MPRIVAVTTEDELLEIIGGKNGNPIRYSDVGDAAGDLDGGDYLSWLCEQHPGKLVKEFRIVLDKPMKT